MNVAGTGPPGSYHCRQRSCDSLSGTVGGQRLEEDFGYHDDSKLRRSMTPNPESQTQDVCPPARRAITPGPEWGRYDSDEEDHGKKPAIGHKRQSSYLNAFDFVDNSQAPNQQVPAPSGGQMQHKSQSDYGKLPADKGGVQVCSPGE